MAFHFDETQNVVSRRDETTGFNTTAAPTAARQPARTNISAPAEDLRPDNKNPALVALGAKKTHARARTRAHTHTHTTVNE